MTRRTRRQRAWDAAADVISALALMLLGLALASGDISFGAMTISQSPFAGAALMIAGALFGVAALMGPRRARSDRQK